LETSRSVVSVRLHDKINLKLFDCFAPIGVVIKLLTEFSPTRRWTGL